MNKITVKINGMMCGMCEAHIKDTIRREFPDAKKVAASKSSGEATFVTENPVDEKKLTEAINATGYEFVSFASEPYKKRGLFGR